MKTYTIPVVLFAFIYSANSLKFMDINTQSVFQWDDFFNNVKIILKYTNTVNAIYADNFYIGNYNGLDFYEEFIKYFMKNRTIPLNLSKSFLNVNRTYVVPNPEFGSKRLITLTYDSYRSFNQSLFVDNWAIFNEFPNSFYVVLLMDAHLEGDCSIDIFQNQLNLLLDTFWRQYEIANVFVALPRFCSFTYFFKFNPFKRFLETVNLNGDGNSLVHSQNNLCGYPLKINIFSRTPTLLLQMPPALVNSYLAKDTENVGSIAGVDGFFLGNVVKWLNVTPVVSESASCCQYGSLLSNGTFTGSLGDVVYKRADMAINARFLQHFGTKEVEYTTTTYSDQLCLITPKAPRVPYWLSVFLVFRISTWCLVLFTSLVLSLLWWLIKTKISKYRDTDSTLVFMEILLLIVSRPVKPPRSTGEKLFICTCLFFNLVFVGCFQGYMIMAYSTVTYEKNINTFEEVERSGMPISVSQSIGEVFGYNVSTLRDKLRRRTYMQEPTIFPHKAQGEITTQRKLDAKILIELNYTDLYGEQLYHIVDESPGYFYLVYIVRRGYPFLMQINRFIMRANSAGLFRKWYDFVEYSAMLKARFQRKFVDEQYSKVFLDDLLSAMGLLVLGLLMALCVFAMEIFVYKRSYSALKKY